MQSSSGALLGNTDSTHPDYRPDIDGLRAIAVLSVVVYHAFPSLLGGGYVGVDIFFVISGYLISTIIFRALERQRFSFADFYARRIRRIFPALLLVLVSCLAVGWRLLLTDEYARLGKQVAAGAAFVSNFVLWGDAGYFDPGAAQKPLLHLWSLGIEEQFYFCWPLLAWAAYRRHSGFLALTLGIALISFVINVASVAAAPVAAFYSPLSRFWELMVGGALAYLMLHRPAYPGRYANACSVGGVALIALAIALLRTNSLFPGWWALLPTVGAFLVLSAGTHAWFNRVILGNRLLVGVGLISYPLYLWHWPALFFNFMLNSPPSRASRVIAVLVATALATATYLALERPIRRSRSLRGLPLALGVAMALCAGCGIAALVTNGFPGRLPPQFTQFANNAESGAPQSPCFLTNRSDFDPLCTAFVRHPSIFVWGDSHADRLYRGLEQFAAQGKIGLQIVTGGACPPIAHYISSGNNACPAINDFALNAIRQQPPDVLILHANWASDTIDLGKLEAALTLARQTGARKVVLLGPVPQWGGSLLRSLFLCWHPSSAAEPLPESSACGLQSKVRETDEALRAMAGRAHVEYISSYDALCRAGACRVHFPDETPDMLETYDYGHLSSAASRYLIRAIYPGLLPGEQTTEIH